MAARSHHARTILADIDFRDRSEIDGVAGRIVVEVAGAEMQVAPAFGRFIPERQPRQALGRSPTAVSANRTAELVLAGPKDGGRPGVPQVFRLVIKTDPQVAKRRERLEERRAFHEGRVAETADDLQTERLLPLADADIAEHGQIGGFHPHVGERCRPVMVACSCVSFDRSLTVASTLPIGGSHRRFNRYVGQTRNDPFHSYDRIQAPTVCGDSRVTTQQGELNRRCRWDFSARVVGEVDVACPKGSDAFLARNGRLPLCRLWPLSVSKGRGGSFEYRSYASRLAAGAALGAAT